MVVEETFPEVGLKLIAVEANPVPVVLDISNRDVGAITTLPDNELPETVKVCSAEGPEPV